MIVRTKAAGEKPRPSTVPKNAEEVLSSLRFFFASGNQCLVTPCMRLIDAKRCAIAIIYEWNDDPSDSDKEELEGSVGCLMGKDPAYRAETKSSEVSTATAEDWLAQRKPS